MTKLILTFLNEIIYTSHINMGSNFQPEKQDRLTDREHQESDLTRQQKWAGEFFMLNSCALYQIGMVISHYYLNNDRLPLSYHFFVGIISSILALIIEQITKHRAHKFKVWLVVLIMAGMVLTALFIPRL